MTNITLTMAELMQRLSEKNLLPDRAKTEALLLDDKSSLEPPVPIKILTGIGAFVASVFIIGLIVTIFAAMGNSYTYLIVWGSIFILAALGLNMAVKDQTSNLHVFLLQTSLAFMASGKMMFAAGVFMSYENSSDFSGWSITYTLTALTILTYPFYHITVGRFLAVLAICISIFANLFFDGSKLSFHEFGFNLFFFAQITLSGFLFTYNKSKATFAPIAYAVIISLCLCTLMLASQAFLRAELKEFAVNPFIINLILTATLIAVILWASGILEDMKSSSLKNEAVILAILGAVILGYISIPALLFGLILMIFGYARHDKILVVLGILITPYALWLYYYNLNITLLQKSGILIGSGFILLAGYAYISYRGWNKISHNKENEQ